MRVADFKIGMRVAASNGGRVGTIKGIARNVPMGSGSHATRALVVWDEPVDPQRRETFCSGKSIEPVG